MFIVLVDSGNTHKFIHRRVTQDTHCNIHAMNNFQIMIANGVSMKCGGHCENVCLKIGDYSLKSHMFFNEMVGCDIVLSVEWLHTFGPITMDFQELHISFQQVGHRYTLHGITSYFLDIFTSHHMEKLLKKYHYGNNTHIHVIKSFKTPSQPNQLNMQSLLTKHQSIFYIL